MRKIIAIILFVVVLIISTVFALNNNQETAVNYLFGSTNLSLSMIVFWSGLSGLALGILGMLIAVYKYRHRVSRQKKQIAKLEKELNHLRQQPVSSKDPF
ncbi:LapA family protein [Kangiella marina]|uniref:Lipopolysaccharide assembly protein A domain-containing protein n=1 Tax=Kangiella marina TaxID=1079178 RepID=A0ABP8IP86_9GAMM